MKTRLKGGSEYEFNTFGDAGQGAWAAANASIDKAAKAFADRKQEEQEAEAKRRREELDSAVAMAGAAARARKAEAETRIKATAARMTSSIRDETARRTGPIRRRLR